jgi:hypothetical protein
MRVLFLNSPTTPDGRIRGHALSDHPHSSEVVTNRVNGEDEDAGYQTGDMTGMAKRIPHPSMWVQHDQSASTRA